jgi:hypothetical protein
MSAGDGRPARGSCGSGLPKLRQKGRYPTAPGVVQAMSVTKGSPPGAERFGATKIVASGAASVARPSIRLGDKGGLGGQLA